MKKIVILYLFIGLSIFPKENQVNTSPHDLVCREIKIIAGDNSKISKILEEYSNPNSTGLTYGMVRCENSTSICYGISSNMTCHKK